jgi:hypothetical protein
MLLLQLPLPVLLLLLQQNGHKVNNLENYVTDGHKQQ